MRTLGPDFAQIRIPTQCVDQCDRTYPVVTAPKPSTELVMPSVPKVHGSKDQSQGPQPVKHKRVAEWTAAEQLVVETASKQQSAKVEKSTEKAQKPVEGQNAVRNCSPDEYEPSSNSSAVSLCTS